MLETSPNADNHFVNSHKWHLAPIKPVGTHALHDVNGREIKFDGNAKLPYRHPHFVQVKRAVRDNQQGIQQVQEVEYAENGVKKYTIRNKSYFPL